MLVDGDENYLFIYFLVLAFVKFSQRAILEVSDYRYVKASRLSESPISPKMLGICLIHVSFLSMMNLVSKLEQSAHLALHIAFQYKHRFKEGKEQANLRILSLLD